MSPAQDPFGARDHLEAGGRSYVVARLDALGADLGRMPYTVKVLLENVLRNAGREFVTEDDVRALVDWRPGSGRRIEVPFLPARVLLQDFTGVPCRGRPGGHARRHDGAWAATRAGSTRWCRSTWSSTTRCRSIASARPAPSRPTSAREFERNRERYALLRWAQQAFDNFRVVPPGTGIVHQVNLEYLAQAVIARAIDGDLLGLPRHAGGHRLAHHDDQRPRRAGLGRRRHRGRGGHAGPAALPCSIPEVVGFEAPRRAAARAPPPPTWC